MKDFQQYIEEKIGLDKLCHFAFTGWITSYFHNVLLILIIAITIGLLKESFDYYIRKRNFDIYDYIASITSAFINILILLIC